MKKLLTLMLREYEFIERNMLTVRQLEVVNWLRPGGTMDSVRLADEFGISVQSASQLLHKIWRKGYFKRDTVPDTTGGNFFVYRYAL